MSDNIWTGEKVRLRAWEPDDWQHQVRWSQDTGADRRTYYIPFPMSEVWTRKHAEDLALRRPENDAFHLIIETLDGTPVGVLSTSDADSKNGTFSFGVFIEEEHRRRGFAREAVILIMRYFFLERRYQKCGTGAYGFNEPSQNLLESLGFQLEGRHRRMEFTNGEYHDMLYFGITIEEFCEKHADWLKRNTPRDSPAPS